MEAHFNHKEVEQKIKNIWEQGDYFTPKIDPSKKPFSITLWPPNASGPMHVGNALMIAIQDILARYHRGKGDPTLWVPCTDHGGYETQVTFEKELEKNGKDRSDYSDKDLFQQIKNFVDNNNRIIKNQISSLGASVDWTRFRFTLDDKSLVSVDQKFRKMLTDKLIYRRPYMVHYCTECATILSDIELKENKVKMPLYFVKFKFENSETYIPLATSRPEFLFATTHLLIHPSDTRYSEHIGKRLINPITGDFVEIVASKRKFDPKNPDPFLSPFSPSYDKYDYEYTLRNSIPSQNLLDWEGKLIGRNVALNPLEARSKEVTYLSENGFIEKVDDTYIDSTYLCKRGHIVENLIVLTWFLKLDDEKVPLRKPALDAIQREGLTVLPKWREKGLLEWIGKMPDWPIARQNVWGIKIPIWYEIEDPSKFVVWFVDKAGKKQNGNLGGFLNQGFTLIDIEQGLQRIYAGEGVTWTMEKEEGKTYLPETDSFDTWFSSGDWSAMVYGTLGSPDFSYFYPGDSIVMGHDLLRLSVCREIFMSLYLTGKLPFKIVYLHRLLKGPDGQKMSKSLGNAVPLEYYTEKYGADATRMAMVSYTMEKEDFIFSEDRLNFFKKFGERLWKIARVTELANIHSVPPFKPENLSLEDRNLLTLSENLVGPLSSYIEKYLFEPAEAKVVDFLSDIEKYVEGMQSQRNIALPLSVLRQVFKKYLILLHPFAPFITEELNSILYNSSAPLASTPWPNKERR